jgi:calcineurin-like phosphoesterase family protein
MTGTWFIGDPHFGHQKVSEIRGFDSTEAHDLAIFRRWERQVRPDDLVYVMGDISGGSRTGEIHALNVLNMLPGRKILVAGNHDSVSGIHRRKSPDLWLFRETFEDIKDFARIRIEGQQILLSHYPYMSQGDGPGRGHARYEQFRLPDLGERLIHAHTHHSHPTSGSTTGRELCVSWDAWRRIVNIGDVHNWIKEPT